MEAHSKGTLTRYAGGIFCECAADATVDEVFVYAMTASAHGKFKQSGPNEWLVNLLKQIKFIPHAQN